MKPRLLFPTQDSDWDWALSAAEMRDMDRTGRRYHGEFVPSSRSPPWNADSLAADLELETLLSAMAGEDDGIYVVARQELLCAASNDAATIGHRQQVLGDALEQRALLRELFAIADAALREQKRHSLGKYERSYPDAMLRWAVEIIETLLPLLRRLHDCAIKADGAFASSPWRAFWGSIRDELSPAYLAEVEAHAAALKGRDAELMSAALGEGNQGADYRLHGLAARQLSLWERLLNWLFPPRGGDGGDEGYGIQIAPNDENGHRALRDLNNRGIEVAAKALGQGALHICDFFAALRVELSFYVGCINLHEQLEKRGEPASFPDAVEESRWKLAFDGLYDPCLALRRDTPLVGNRLDADPVATIVITGANEGGKSTFLRSLGVAQLMMQAGMFVPAEHFSSTLCPAILTHFRREEDKELRKGKFDEELSRMSEIVDHVTPASLLLCNESFSSTNEREGSEIARQVLGELRTAGVRIAFVTHLHLFARTLFEQHVPGILFLRAERDSSGQRTFALREAEPLATGFAGDLYSEVFGEPLGKAAA
jgi:hypothetical protein